MPQKRYSLEKGGPKEIEISWKQAWKSFTVKHKGQVVGITETQEELKRGVQFSLLDDSTLRIRLYVGFGKTGLEILRNDQPLPGSDADPYKKIKTAFIMLLCVAGMNILGGTLIALTLSEFMYVGMIVFVYGLVFVGLAFGVREGIIATLIIAIILLVVDTSVSLVYQSWSHSGATVVWIILRALFLVYLLQAIKPLREIKRKISLINQ